MKQLFSILFCFISILSLVAENKIKVSCIGDSVTYGARISNRERDSYPAQLQLLLGDLYNVRNFGKSGTTLLSKGHRPYINQKEYADAIDFAGDIVVIHLGLNDTDPRNWPNYRDEFVTDYVNLIQSFRTANPSCEIKICRMTPISPRHPRFKSGTRDWYWMEQAVIEEIARQENLEIIDLTELLYRRQNLLPDGLHPNEVGARIIAQRVASSITGDFGGLQIPAFYSDNMVIQRNKPFIIEGIANAGDEINCVVYGKGHSSVSSKELNLIKHSTIAAKNGKWRVELAPLPVGGPYKLEISTKKTSYKFKNIMVGDVWMCSGQSNMRFMLKQSTKAEQDEFLRAISKLDNIRLYNMTYPENRIWDKAYLDRVNNLEFFNQCKWEKLDKENALEFSAIALQFGKMLSDSLNVPIGLINNSVGGSPTESWVDRQILEFEFPELFLNWYKNDFVMQWVRERAALNIEKSKDPLQRHSFHPSYLFDSGVNVFKNFNIAGVIWYQGESNADKVEVHEKLFPMVVKTFRNSFGEDLPFYYVQLSSILRPTWGWFRNSQREMMYKIPDVGMAVSSDRADSNNKNNVHPRRKKDIGRRLGLLALDKTFGFNLVSSGPMYRNVIFEDNAAYLEFDSSDNMRSSDGEDLSGFEIAEKYGRFYKANAVVINNRVKVWSDKVKNPKYVRYGWQPYSTGNLINSSGLPASTFKTF